MKCLRRELLRPDDLANYGNVFGQKLAKTCFTAFSGVLAYTPQWILNHEYRGDMKMAKIFHAYLLCGALAAPFLGPSNAHAASIVNHFGWCLDDQSGSTQDRNPIVARQCFGLFEQQWRLAGSSIMGIGTGETGDPGQPSHSKCLTIFSGAEGTPVLLVECQRVLQIRRLQNWNYSGGQIHSTLNGLCLTHNGISDTQVTLQTCDSGNPGQFWAIRS
ncbi:RICIN domain-containing protein [Methyloterricola oryzae]|uniref:RICIN domain-containing protein n=1 Tax=Methyloterricola oryzae TaxID=1495050 RepID=UPI0005EBC033|nr:RICIN domain-containing protein [Methyloterricola oryzae]